MFFSLNTCSVSDHRASSAGLPHNITTLAKLNRCVCCDRIPSFRFLPGYFQDDWKPILVYVCGCILLPQRTIWIFPVTFTNKNNGSVGSHIVCVSILVTWNIYKHSPWMSFACNSPVRCFSLSLASVHPCVCAVAYSNGHLKDPASAKCFIKVTYCAWWRKGWHGQFIMHYKNTSLLSPLNTSYFFIVSI